MNSHKHVVNYQPPPAVMKPSFLLEVIGFENKRTHQQVCEIIKAVWFLNVIESLGRLHKAIKLQVCGLECVLQSMVNLFNFPGCPYKPRGIWVLISK